MAHEHGFHGKLRSYFHGETRFSACHTCRREAKPYVSSMLSEHVLCRLCSAMCLYRLAGPELGRRAIGTQN
jgi:hypothetical protein